MKVSKIRRNAKVQYFDDLGPWIASTFKNFTTRDLEVSDFGPKHCQVIQDGNITVVGDTTVKVVTDGEVLINAIFTPTSLHNFYQSSNNDSTWQDKVLMLEKFTISHLADVNEFGELVVRVEKFCCIGEPKYAAHQFPFQLYWAGTLPVVRKTCQDIWENKLLDGVDGTLEFSDITLYKHATFVSPTGISFPSDIRSARNILIASFEERQILNSLPGWCKDNKISKTKRSLPFVNEAADVVNQKQLELINKCSSKNEGNESNQSKIFGSNNELKRSDHYTNRELRISEDISSGCGQINMKTCEMKMQDSKLTPMKNQMAITSSGNIAYRSISLSPQSEHNSAYSIIKQNLEKEEQRLMSLMENSYPPSSVCIESYCDANTNVPLNSKSLSSLSLNANKNNSPVQESYKKECISLHSERKSIIHKTISPDSETVSSQDTLLGKVSHASNKRNNDNYYASNELFYTQYYTPTHPKSKKVSISIHKPCFRENPTSEDRKQSNNQLLAISSRNKSNDGTVDSLPDSLDGQRIVGTLDKSASKVANNLFVNMNQSIAVNSRKKLKLSSSHEAELCKSDFNDNSQSQNENKIKIPKDKNRVIVSCATDTIQSFPHIKRTDLACIASMPVNEIAPKGCSKIIMEHKLSELEQPQGKHLNECVQLPLKQKFDWSFSKVHIEAMWIKFFELFLERSKQLQE